MAVLRRRELVCQEVVELLSDYLEGALPRRDRRRLEAHLEACPHCAEYLAQLRRTIDALGHVGSDPVPDEVVDDLVTLYERWRAG